MIKSTGEDKLKLTLDQLGRRRRALAFDGRRCVDAR